MYTLAKILVNLFVILFFVAAFFNLFYVWYLYLHPSFGDPKRIKKNKPVEKPQIIKKQPEAPKVPRHYTWKGCLSLFIILFSIGYLIYELFF